LLRCVVVVLSGIGLGIRVRVSVKAAKYGQPATHFDDTQMQTVDESNYWLCWSLGFLTSGGGSVVLITSLDLNGPHRALTDLI